MVVPKDSKRTTSPSMDSFHTNSYNNKKQLPKNKTSPKSFIPTQKQIKN
jgi:hypothetical protein